MTCAFCFLKGTIKDIKKEVNQEKNDSIFQLFHMLYYKIYM